MYQFQLVPKVDESIDSVRFEQSTIILVLCCRWYGNSKMDLRKKLFPKCSNIHLVWTGHLFSILLDKCHRNVCHLSSCTSLMRNIGDWHSPCSRFSYVTECDCNSHNSIAFKLIIIWWITFDETPGFYCTNGIWKKSKLRINWYVRSYFKISNIQINQRAESGKFGQNLCLEAVLDQTHLHHITRIRSISVKFGFSCRKWA